MMPRRTRPKRTQARRRFILKRDWPHLLSREKQRIVRVLAAKAARIGVSAGGARHDR